MNDSNLSVSVTAEECPSPHSLRNKLGRLCWGIVSITLFRCSPRVLHVWRRWLLRLFGANIAAHVKVDPSAMIWAPWNLTMEEESSLGHHVDCYCIAPVVIGAHATVSQYAILCTGSHDVTDPHMSLISSPIRVEAQAWVCAAAFLGPGITIHEGAVVGARAVATRDVPAWTIVVGNPARYLKDRVLVSSETTDA